MDLIEQANLLFGDLPRPKHFTNHRHCCECAEHDETFQAHTPKTIGLDELGSPAWDPVCFATPEAYQYFFPAFVRLALEGRGPDYYVDQFLFHLIWDGECNIRWQVFSPEQRQFVRQVLEALLETKAEEIDQNLDTDPLFLAFSIWSDDGS